MKQALKVVAAIFLPPLGVALQNGVQAHFFINLALTVCSFGVLGIIHALYVVTNPALDTVHWDD